MQFGNGGVNDEVWSGHCAFHNGYWMLHSDVGAHFDFEDVVAKPSAPSKLL
jgi:hypothetical protein